MSKGKLIAQRDGYEIRQYGTWVRGWVNEAGEYCEERGEEPMDERQETLDKNLFSHAERIIMNTLSRRMRCSTIPQLQE